jgi:4,5-DOPA dioxygenase extradiol
MRILRAPAMERPTPNHVPPIFLAHGSPLLLDDAAWMQDLRTWADALPRPRAILMLSAHWEQRPATLGATQTVPLIYDFYGFPQRYYDVTYPSPGAPELAARVRELLGAARLPFQDDPRRGLDHGAYVPLVAMYPAADVPVLQLSLPSEDPRDLFAVGRALAPLRDEGVLIVGSGFLSHNLGLFRRLPEGAPVPAWAQEFDAWAAEALQKRDLDALLDYEQRAPALQLNLPTREHFVPVIVAAGAAPEGAAVTFPIRGFAAGAMTKRSVQFGA